MYGRLLLFQGNHPQGALDIFVVYLDPGADAATRCASLRIIRRYIRLNAHTIILGDFNFVECEQDRYMKEEGIWSFSDDKNVAKEWSAHILSKGMKEWSQENFTFENSRMLSRLDRVYSSLHAAHSLLEDVYCHVLDRVPEVSDHNPIGFGMRAPPTSQTRKFPGWVLDNELFQQEFDRLCARAD